MHQPHFFRPALQIIKAFQQIVGEIGDGEKPLGQLALFNRRAGAPALAVDHLLIGQHGIVYRIPVDAAFAAAHQPLGEHVQKQLLLLGVILHIAGGEFTLPVNGQAHLFELLAHGPDIGVGPFARMHLVFHGGVFGGHAKGVPAHGMQHVEAFGAPVSCHHVAHGVIAHMPHVNAPGRIGKHFQHVIFGPLVLAVGVEGVCVTPDFLPVLFARWRVIAFVGHA